MGALGDQLVEAGWRADENLCRVLRLAAAFAESDEWALAGYSTPGRWIADRLDVALRTANEWIQTGRELASLPAISAAFDAKQLSFAKVRVLVRTARPATEAALLDLAMQVPAAELAQAIAWWSNRSEPDAVVDERHRESRGLRWEVDVDGSIVGSFRVPPARGGVLTAAVDAQVMRRTLPPDAGDDGCWPSLAQQRIDALIELLTSEGGGAQFEVVVHVRGDGCTLDDGTPLTESAVAQLLPASFVRLLIHDAERHPVNASGRQRRPTTRQKRVVKERDRACVDCGSHDLLEYDHVPAYEVTGRTVVEELELRCAPCHRSRHLREAA